jgi:hypothetical protein
MAIFNSYFDITRGYVVNPCKSKATPQKPRMIFSPGRQVVHLPLGLQKPGEEMLYKWDIIIKCYLGYISVI